MCHTSLTVDALSKNKLTFIIGPNRAGKSSLFNALKFVLGAQMDSDIIKKGAEFAQVSLTINNDTNLGSFRPEWFQRHSIIIVRRFDRNCSETFELLNYKEELISNTQDDYFAYNFFLSICGPLLEYYLIFLLRLLAFFGIENYAINLLSQRMNYEFLYNLKVDQLYDVIFEKSSQIETVASVISYNFEEMALSNDIDASLKFDHCNKTIEILIEGKPVRLFSAGEHRVVVVVLLLAVWNALKIPIGGIDGFDVGLDAETREMLTRTLIKQGSQMDGQYFFISPFGMNSVIALNILNIFLSNICICLRFIMKAFTMKLLQCP